MRGYKRTLYLPSHRRKYIANQVLSIDWNLTEKEPEVILTDKEIKRMKEGRICAWITIGIVILVVLFK